MYQRRGRGAAAGSTAGSNASASRSSRIDGLGLSVGRAGADIELGGIRGAQRAAPLVHRVSERAPLGGLRPIRRPHLPPDDKGPSRLVCRDFG
jgi:hypothetical protein